MRKLTKGEKRNLLNEIRHHENMIAKIEKVLYEDEISKVLLTGKKTITELVKIETNNVSTLSNRREMNNELKVDVEHVRCGNKIVCTMKYTPRNIEVEGVAICAEDDNFNVTLGMSIAECRATAKMFELLAKAFGNLR